MFDESIVTAAKRVGSLTFGESVYTAVEHVECLRSFGVSGLRTAKSVNVFYKLGESFYTAVKRVGGL